MRTNKKKEAGSAVRRNALLAVLSVVGFLMIWQLLVKFGVFSEKILPIPSQVFTTFLEKLHSPNPDGAVLQYNILISLKVALSGLSLAILLGVPLGLLMGWYRCVDRFVRPVFELIRPIPPIAWIPLTILWVGIGMPAKAMIIFFASFIPCLINAYAGIKGTSQTLVNVAKTYGASNFTIFLKVGVPSAMPLTFAGIRISLGSAWSTLVAAELLAANAGLGYMISMGRQFGRPDIIVLGMIVIGLLGFLFSWIFNRIERVVVKWRTV